MLVHQLTKNQAPHSMSFTETLHKTLLLEPNCGHRFEQNLVDTVVDFASKVSPDFHSLELQAMCKFSMLVAGIPKQFPSQAGLAPSFFQNRRWVCPDKQTMGILQCLCTLGKLISVSGFFAFDGKKARPGIGAVLRLPSSITEHVHPAFARLESPNPSNAVHVLEGGPQVPEKSRTSLQRNNKRAAVQSKVRAFLQRSRGVFKHVPKKTTHDVKDRFADELEG